MNQKSLFPEIDVENKHTLFIIGNGFDLAHGIKSQYSDFAKWVRQQGNDRLVRMMEIFFSNKRDFWGDIENALGEYDEEEIVDWCSPDEGVDYDTQLVQWQQSKMAPIGCLSQSWMNS